MFDHEKLDVYRVAIEFAAWVGELLDGPLKGCSLSAVKHLDQAHTSIPNNIAEGNGRRSPKDRCRFVGIAKGSALESASCLDVLVARKKLEPQRITHGKQLLKRIVEMLVKWEQQLVPRI
jgi:four helix bundle protein